MQEIVSLSWAFRNENRQLKIEDSRGIVSIKFFFRGVGQNWAAPRVLSLRKLPCRRNFGARNRISVLIVSAYRSCCVASDKRFYQTTKFKYSGEAINLLQLLWIDKIQRSHMLETNLTEGSPIRWCDFVWCSKTPLIRWSPERTCSSEKKFLLRKLPRAWDVCSYESRRTKADRVSVWLCRRCAHCRRWIVLVRCILVWSNFWNQCWRKRKRSRHNHCQKKKMTVSVQGTWAFSPCIAHAEKTKQSNCPQSPDFLRNTQVQYDGSFCFVESTFAKFQAWCRYFLALRLDWDRCF